MKHRIFKPNIAQRNIHKPFVPKYSQLHSRNSNPQNYNTDCLFLHGILANGKMFEKFFQLYVNGRPGLKVTIPDLRNHGLSADMTHEGPHTLETTANDLEQIWMQQLIEKEGNHNYDVIIGYSFGGKVASSLIKSAQTKMNTQQLWIIDTFPGTKRELEQDTTSKIIDFIENIKIPIQSPEWLKKEIKNNGFSPNIFFLLKENLRLLPEGGYDWVFNKEGVKEMLCDYYDIPIWDFLKTPPEGLQIHFIQAGKSDRWTREASLKLHSSVNSSNGRTKIHIIPDADHYSLFSKTKDLFHLFDTYFPKRKI